jgi:peptidyl-prolyl cis-trans isomerase D
MTMLDRMRRHKSWLKWSLALVCLTFVVFYIPSFLRTDTTAANTGDRVASVDSRPITVAEYRRRYLAQVNAYRQSYGGNLSDAVLQQLQVPQQVLQQMIEENAEITEAQKMGISVSDDEVRQQIMAIPGLQENGHFIGEDRYRALLRAQDPPMMPADFEQTVRQSIMLDKFRAGLTEWMSISDAELEKEYKQKNEKVTLDVVAILADNFKNQANPTDAEVAAHFDANKEKYRIPEQRKIRFVRINTADMASKIYVPREDVERYYNEHLGTYTTPEQIRASHILLKTEGKNDADVRTKAEGILKEVKAGGDFAALAKKYSEDDSNAQQGGDLDYFSHGRMVPEFETAAFALAPGEVSDLVKTQFGYHIIKVTDRKPAITRDLKDAALYKEIETQVQRDQADVQVSDLADGLAREGTTPQALDKAAATRGLKVEESGFFPRGGMIDALGPQSPASTTAFTLADNAVSEPISTPLGRVLFYVSGKSASYLPKLDEVKSKVRDDLIQARAGELAKKKAEEVAALLKSGPDFQKAAKAAGLEAVTTPALARDAVIPNIGKSPEVDAVAFSLPVGGVSGAIVTPQGAAIVKVDAKQDVSAAEFAAARDKFRADTLNARRTQFYQAYMEKARKQMKIDINAEAVKRAVGSA